MLDGKLTARERARLTEHLAGCESCYEIFAGTAHILDDSREEQLQAAATTRPFERPREARALRPRAWWAAAALAAVLAATVALVVFLQGGRGAGPSTEQLASLVGPAPSGKVNWGNRLRGGGGAGTEEQPELPPEDEAFQLGVRFLDLRLTLASGNREEADDALRRFHLLFERMPIPPLEARASYDELRKRLGAQVRPPTLLAAAAAAEKKTMEELLEDPRLVELGRWTEACRLAAEKGRADLFRKAATLRVLDEAMRPGGKDADNLDPQALAKVRSLRDTIASGRVDPATLGARCADLLRQLAGDDQ